MGRKSYNPDDWTEELREWRDDFNRYLRTHNYDSVYGYDKKICYLLDWMNDNGLTPDTASEADLEDYVLYLQDDKGNADSTIATNLDTIITAYDYAWELDSDKVRKLKTLRKHRKGDSYQEHPIKSREELADLLKSVWLPWEKAIVAMPMYTGMRRDAIMRIMLSHVYINDPEVEALYDEHGIELHDALDRANDSAIYVPEEIAKGATRGDANPRIIPMKRGLEAILKRYLAIRPFGEEYPDNFFISVTKNYGSPMQGIVVHNVLKKYTKPRGWYVDNRDDGKKNITPHYFRHWIRTKVNLDRDLHMYLRGDKEKASQDHYLHIHENYGEELNDGTIPEEEMREALPEFLDY